MAPKKFVCGVLATAVTAGAAIISIPSLALAAPVLPAGSTLRVDDRSSVVLAEASGDAARALAAENRWFRHTDLQPTGRFVRAGQTLSITLPSGASGLEVGIGLYGVHSGQNGGKDVGIKTTALSPGTNEVTATVDGMVYIKNRTGTADAVVEVAGGQPVPTWVENETTRTEFDEDLRTWPSAPYVELVGDRVLVDFQAGVGRPGLSGASKDIDALIGGWDRAVEATNDLYGLTDDVAGVARKHEQRIYIANPDTGGGYASATEDRITFQNDTAAGRELIEYGLAGRAHWGFWHEVGHTYQPKDLRWGGMTEVTVNISALAAQEELGHPNRLDDSATRRKVAEFRQTAVTERRYDSIGDPFLKVLMFDQLRRGFGDDFYPRLAQEWRVEKALGTSPASNDLALTQHFARTASQVADRDLTPFFEQWGFSLTPETRDVLGSLPALRHDIWNNHDRASDVIEREVGDYVVPVGTMALGDIPTVTIGRESMDGDAALVEDLTNSDGSAGARSVSTSVTALREGVGAGRVNALLENDRGVRNVLSEVVDVSRGNLLRFNGIERTSGGTTVVDVALDEATGTLRALSRGVRAHDYFGSDEYLGIDVVAPSGRIVLGASVRGIENADAFAEVLDRYEYQDGQYLVIRHQEANSRLIRFADDQQQARLADKVQYFRIVDDRLVRVGASDVPSCAGDCAPTASVDDTEEGAWAMIRGENFVSGEKVTVGSVPGGISGQGVVRDDGSVSIVVMLSSSIVAGDYELTLTGPSSRAGATTTLTVTEKDDVVPPPGGGSCGVVPESVS